MKNNSNDRNGQNRLTVALFAVYLTAMCWILLLKLGVHFSNMGKRNANLIPFSRTQILNSENILNVVIFLPLGIYTAILFRRWSFGKKLLFFFSLSLLVEATQYILRIGVFDVTDIITNTLGGVIGLILFELIVKAFNDRTKAQKFINTVATIGTVLIILFLVLLKMNMLPVRYQ